MEQRSGSDRLHPNQCFSQIRAAATAFPGAASATAAGPAAAPPSSDAERWQRASEWRRFEYTSSNCRPATTTTTTTAAAAAAAAAADWGNLRWFRHIKGHDAAHEYVSGEGALQRA